MENRPCTHTYARKGFLGTSNMEACQGMFFLSWIKGDMLTQRHGKNICFLSEITSVWRYTFFEIVWLNVHDRSQDN